LTIAWPHFPRIHGVKSIKSNLQSNLIVVSEGKNFSYISQSEIILSPDDYIGCPIGMKLGIFFGLPTDYSCKVSIHIF
jgi:hypothetical protein